jgi:pimeloyl-ACP methyl ester carboxylesterase
MQEHFWKERGIYYRTNELRPDRVTLVFVHGLLGSSSAWRKFEGVFGGTYNILGVDLRGYGRSLKPNEYDAYDLEKIASDVAALIDHLRVTSFIPISHSAGTLVAVALLRIHPKGARAAIFMSPLFGIAGHRLTQVARPLMRSWTRLLRRFDYSTVPGRHIDYTKYDTTGDWSPRRISADLPNDTVHVFSYFLDHVYERDYDPWLHELRLPMLVMYGTKDSISPPKQIEGIKKYLPHAAFREIKGANHIMPLNRFEDVQRVIADYLSSIVDDIHR